MKNEVLDAELKTRVPRQYKKKFHQIAISRHLRISDILREAIREKIETEVIPEKAASR